VKDHAGARQVLNQKGPMKTMRQLSIAVITLATFSSLGFASPNKPENLKKEIQLAKNTTSKSISASEKKKPDQHDIDISKEIITQIVREDVELAVQANRMKITTVNGHVTLTGKVRKARQKEKIGSIAANVVGVTNIDNQLVVK
jgi:osmotically-inducible protein OsmY